ncbi:uncharacterized protein [Physcomitrium patens]|uniref:Uncharacterized protein n=1 Tax=Physcomitrium patens TaxID=3218 RepID=A0A2K1KJL2_PHYPA|nr:uncharacterized protein LOC112282002 [Physcomitrium patens]XP_024374850.1 uncharacterized protein LOC112282002 [Physcomitrium patens]XP_024374851.1 uncharacterized protein LOC112282002 [Physcomitrium patens]PNR53962.1 hypothetical protein PHYPA_007637 [Physcomitrium patens]|eukprot:XP_024374848.1 uncharacterized protein LOC112282002 [Physcomitrella patens]
MERRKGDVKRRTSSRKQRAILNVRQESVRAKEERLSSTAHSTSLNANGGELPLSDFPTQLKDSSLNSRNARVRSDVSVDVNLGKEDCRWPLKCTEVATWASSFRFELDTQDGQKVQAMLEEDACDSRRKTGDENSKETLGGSFRFRNRVLELSGHPVGFLKPPRQLEEALSADRFPACAMTNVHSTNAEQARDELESRDGWELAQAKTRNSLHVAVSVPNSPVMGTNQRKLGDFKSRPSTPGLVSADMVSYQEEMAIMAVERDDLQHKLKSSTQLLKGIDSGENSDSTPVKEHLVPRKSRCSQQGNEFGELDIMPIAIRRRMKDGESQSSRPTRISSSRLSQEQAIAPMSVRSRNGSVQEQIVSIRKQFLDTVENINIPSDDHSPSFSAAIPFKWEVEPGKPKTDAATEKRVKYHKQHKQGTPRSNCLESELHSSQRADEKLIGSQDCGIGNDYGDNRCTSSHRFYDAADSLGHSRQSSLGHSSRRYDSRVTGIDLDGSAASKFLVEQYDTPLGTPSKYVSSPSIAVPFEWEDAPGKAKVESSLAAQSSKTLQLPPRLAAPYSYRSAESLSRELRASHPGLAGFFAPCLSSSAPVLRQSDRVLVQYTSSKSLPPRLPPQASPPEQRRRRHGLVGRCISIPQEGCQVRVIKSFIEDSFNDKVPYPDSSNKAVGDAPSTASSPGLKLGSSISAETTHSPLRTQRGRNRYAPPSPTSILCGPDESSSLTSTSASNTNFSSGDMEDFNGQKHRSASQSESKSSSSYGSIEEGFPETVSPSCSALHTPHSSCRQRSAVDSSGKGPYSCRTRGPLDAMNKLVDKNKSQGLHATTHSSEVCSPTATKYFQSREITEAAIATTTSTSTEDNSCLLDKRRAPTSSGYLNCEGEPLAIKVLPTIQSLLQLDIPNSNEKGSSMCPPRLPYTMPAGAIQVLSSARKSAREQLIQHPSPRFLEYLGRRLGSCHKSGSNSPNPAQRERYMISCHRFAEVSPSSEHANSIGFLSPGVNLEAQQRNEKTPQPKTEPARSRRRARFMSSIGKALKRILKRQRRRKAIEPPSVYRNGPALTTQSSKLN